MFSNWSAARGGVAGPNEGLDRHLVLGMTGSSRISSILPVAFIVALAVAAGLAGCSSRTRKPVEGEKVLTHVVSEGETLEDIADDYYGDPDRADDIRKFNLMKSDDVEEGEVVRVYMNPEDMEALGRRRRARIPYNEALQQVARGSYLDATTKFREAVELDPDFAEARYNLGVAYQKLDAHDKAIEQFELAIDLRHKNPDYYYALGNSFFHLGEYGRAVAAFRRVLDLDPGHLKAQFSLAVSLENSGKPKRAAREWRRYLELDGDSEWADRARAHLAELEQ